MVKWEDLAANTRRGQRASVILRVILRVYNDGLLGSGWVRGMESAALQGMELPLIDLRE